MMSWLLPKFSGVTKRPQVPRLGRRNPVTAPKSNKNNQTHRSRPARRHRQGPAQANRKGAGCALQRSVLPAVLRDVQSNWLRSAWSSAVRRPNAA
jgi:hypothetical protein